MVKNEQIHKKYRSYGKKIIITVTVKTLGREKSFKLAIPAPINPTPRPHIFVGRQLFGKSFDKALPIAYNTKPSPIRLKLFILTKPSPIRLKLFILGFYLSIDIFQNHFRGAKLYELVVIINR